MTREVRPEEVILLLAEDDDGHAELVIYALRQAGVHNQIIRFSDGEETLKFFFSEPGSHPTYDDDEAYVLLLDIRMPKVDGVEVLQKLKSTPRFKCLPIIMLTTTDDPREVQRCHELGCNNYITKPVDFSAFVETLRRLGLFLLVIRVPSMSQCQ
jgi:CheY-like chemotaxis protein